LIIVVSTKRKQRCLSNILLCSVSLVTVWLFSLVLISIGIYASYIAVIPAGM